MFYNNYKMKKEKKENNQKYLNFWNSFAVGVIFMICYTPFMTTQTMMQRHTGHRREIEGKLTTLGRHFSKCGIQSLALQIIAGVKEGEEDALEIAEGHWLNRLGTIESQGGINSLDERTKI